MIMNNFYDKKIKKKEALLIMAATHDYLFAVANVLIGLKKYSQNMFDDIIIYTDKNAKEQDKNAICKIFSDIIFKEYTFQISNLEDRERLKYFSNMPYARFEMLTYLDRYKKVVWFDSDCLIVDDIRGLLNYGKTGISMSLDLYPYPTNHSIRDFFIDEIDEIDMNATAYASGLIIFSDALKNPLEIRKYLYQKLEQYSSKLKYAEQGILQMMIEKFDLKVDIFPKDIYHVFSYENKNNAKLIHLLGYNKPWKVYLGSAYDEWYDNHKEWINLGGTEAFTFVELLKLNKEEFSNSLDLYSSYKNQFYFFGDKRYQNLLFFQYELNSKCSGAVLLVKSHLSYKIGNAIVNTRPYKLPFVIVKIFVFHIFSKLIFKSIININPTLNKLKLEQYDDYLDALQIKESHLYKIGAMFLKNPLYFLKNRATKNKF